MLNLRKIGFVVSLITVGLVSGQSAFSSDEYSDLDLKGEGKTTKVKLPFSYLHLTAKEKSHIIYQGGYKTFKSDPKASDIIFLGPLRPCIAVVVTDGQKVVAFHKHSTNSFESMGEVLTKELDFSNRANLYARIFTARDNVEWDKVRQAMHGGKDHATAVKDIKDFLDQQMKIPRDHIPAELYNLRNRKEELNHPLGFLGKYEIAELCVAVRLDQLFTPSSQGSQKIQFFSIDPFAEDCMGYKGKMATMGEFMGPKFEDYKKDHPSAAPDTPFVAYDKLPFEYQRGIAGRKFEEIEESYYLKNFGKKTSDLFKGTIKFDFLPFFPLN